ncbi:MAG: DUF202 domain-containing protein [Pegethrix bostrychoides GSE-TBD4-15B]|jgi:putative membrane protein|uniref:DUF202 domain-containing protein n=1 Tax=Pegethrix bostrychoides GSE-TBD4-15B TaxID=2839662 RepID=A0A951PBV4_9CYAN|nr:DUF202 domain-containing protein [Pegethrix bostrychoides GSE-TBD4-15B]
MPSIQPPPPTNDTTELARERNRAAAERTLLSWIQNCLSLIGIGIALDQILTAVNRGFPQNNPLVNLRLAHAISLSLIGLGGLLLLLAVVIYRQQTRWLDPTRALARDLARDLTRDPTRDVSLWSRNELSAGAVILLGIGAMVIILLL